MVATNERPQQASPPQNGGAAATGTWTVKSGLAQMLKGGVIMDVVTAEQAKIAEEAGACAVMALERVPSDIRKDGGVARMSDPEMIAGIIDAVTIPVMAKARIGHFVECLATLATCSTVKHDSSMTAGWPSIARSGTTTACSMLPMLRHRVAITHSCVVRAVMKAGAVLGTD